MELLSECEQITEWVDLYSERLVRASDEPSPNLGTSLRENWDNNVPEEQIAAEVARLIVPATITLSQRATAKFETNEWNGRTSRRVSIKFATESDWLRCFPLGESSRLPTSNEDWHAWAGVALCGENFGLAVFAQELFKDTPAVWEPDGAEARVQPIPTNVFRRILEAK